MASQTAEEWCREQLANLKVADRQLSTLSDIRAHLAQQPESSNWLTLRDIFNCIDDEAVRYFFFIEPHYCAVIINILVLPLI